MKKWKKKYYHDFTFFMIQCSYSINFIFKLTSQSKKKLNLFLLKLFILEGQIRYFNFPS